MWAITSYNAGETITSGDHLIAFGEKVGGLVLDTEEEALKFWDIWTTKPLFFPKRVVLTHKDNIVKEITLP